MKSVLLSVMFLLVAGCAQVDNSVPATQTMIAIQQDQNQLTQSAIELGLTQTAVIARNSLIATQAQTSQPNNIFANLTNVLELSGIVKISYPSNWIVFDVNPGIPTVGTASGEITLALQPGDRYPEPLTVEAFGNNALSLLEQMPLRNPVNMVETTIDGISAARVDTDYATGPSSYGRGRMIVVLPPNSNIWLVIFLGSNMEQWNEFSPIAEQMLGTIEWVNP